MTVDVLKFLKTTFHNVLGSTKVAAFDMDGCLIVPKSGAKFPKDAADWKFLSNKVPTKLKQLHSDGFKVLQVFGFFYT